MNNFMRYFKTDIYAARDQFLGSCDSIGLRVTAYPGHGTGTQADDQPIYADVALAGSPDASSLIILSPAASWLSGCFASSMMTAFLREKLYLELPRHVACLLIHAINPKGPIWPPFNVIQDNHPLPPAKDWGEQFLMAAEAEYKENIHAREKGVALDRAGLAALPLSTMAIPAWDVGVIADIEHRFLRDRQQITLLDFEAVDYLADGVVEIGYSERTVAAQMGDLADCFDQEVHSMHFNATPSAGLLDQAGMHANTLLLKAKIERNTGGDACWPQLSGIIRKVIQRMPEG